MNSVAIEELARKRLKEFWESKGKPNVAAFFPVDAQALIKTILGWECEAKDLVAIDLTPGVNVLGRCSISKNGRHLVEVATKELLISGTWSDPSVQRWTWAHEAGHIVLSHIDPRKNVYECRRVRSAIPRKEQRYRVPEEMTAEVFARALLMPEKAVRDRFKQSFKTDRVWATQSAYAELLGVRPPVGAEIHPENLAEELVTHRDGSGESMCDFFGVSRSAARRRLTELCLVFS
jgi:hypothetical protein